MARDSLQSTYVEFPEDWKLVGTEGVDGFTTRVTHQLPDGSIHVWTSRRHRKGRGGKLRRDGVEHSTGSYTRHNPWLEFWAPGRITWWVAVAFVLGSALFILGSAAPLFEEALGERVAEWSYFIGALIFTGSIYLQVLETINSDPHPIRAENTPDETFRWFAWQPDRLSFLAVFILLVGSLLFNIETTVALLGIAGGPGISWLLSVPSFVGALLFVVATYMQVAETCHRYWCLKIRGISWWSAALNLVGSVGFLVGAFFGFKGVGLSTSVDGLVNSVAFLQGSVFFLLGSYLLFPEMFSE